MLRFVTIVSILSVLWTACVRYHPQPIIPSETAADFAARNLDDLDFRHFAEEHLKKTISPWPNKVWGFSGLLLAAFYYNTTLDIARAKWGQSRARSKTAAELQNPLITLGPQFDANSGKGISPWTWGLSFDIPVETARKRGYRIRRAQELSAMAKLNITTAAWEVRSDLRNNLLASFAARKRADLWHEIVDVQEEIASLMKKRLEVGEVPKTQYIREQSNLVQARFSLLDTKQQIKVSRMRLAATIGLPEKALEGVKISFGIFERPAVNDLYSQTIMRDALLNRTDILSVLAEYNAAQSELQLEIAKQYPDIHLGPGYTWDQGENKWSLGFSLSLPLFNHNEGGIAEAVTRCNEIKARFIALQAKVEGDIKRTKIGYSLFQEKLKAADSIVIAAKKNLDSAQAFFSTGQTDRLSLLETRREYLREKLFRLEKFVQTQKALDAFEDAVQYPLVSPDVSMMRAGTTLKRERKK